MIKQACRLFLFVSFLWVSFSTILFCGSGFRIEADGLEAKLAKASERLVSCAVADVLKQDGQMGDVLHHRRP